MQKYYGLFNQNEVRVSEKPLLTVKEAAEYFGIGQNKLVDITNENCEFTLMNGKKRMIKRIPFEEWVMEQTSI